MTFSLRPAEPHLDCALVLEGEVDHTCARDLQAQLLAFVNELDGDTSIDVRDLAFIDSSGIAALVAGHHAAEEDGRRVVLLAPRPTLVRLLQVTRLADTFLAADGTQELSA
jgi:anti-sigma B factor antagonist